MLWRHLGEQLHVAAPDLASLRAITTTSYWPDLESMTAFTKGEPTKVHHLEHDPEFLVELPQRIEIHRVLLDRHGLR